MILEQVNGRDLRSFPSSNVFQFRVPEAGTLQKITFDAPADLAEDCTLDVNLGTTLSDLTTIYTDQGDRPVIPDGEYTVESSVDVEVAVGDLISVDIDSFAGTNLQFLAVRMEIETGSGGGASALDDLSDVDTATDAPSTGNILVFDGSNWVPSTASGFTIANIFSDDFDDNSIDAAKWNTSPSGVAETGGKLQITLPHGTTARQRSLNAYKFFNSVVTVKVPTLPYGTDTDFALFLSANPLQSFSRYYGISVSGGSSVINAWFGNSSNVKNVAYNPAVHIYWKVICFAGSITYQYSADGTTWDTLATAPFGYGTDSADLDAMYIYLSGYNNSGVSRVVEFDDFSFKRIIQPF